MKLIHKLLFFLFASSTFFVAHAQIKSDDELKETIYKKHKQEVLNYSLKDFDALFLDFLGKQSNSKITLTKEEFYSYTMKIAIFSERQAKLFKSKKNEANANAEDYKSRNYQDYLTQRTAENNK
jgi:hypothetical protein